MVMSSATVTRLLKILRPRQEAQLDLSWVTPALAVGAAPPTDAVASLRTLGVTAILDLRMDDERQKHARWTQAIEDHGIRLYTVPVGDRLAPSPAQLDEGCQWILRELAEGSRVLVCCRAGSGRSATLVVAVLTRLGYPLQEAFRQVSGKRRVANPTDAQLAALRTFTGRTGG